MAKLKYDRPINMRLTNSARVTIPDGEVWKVTTGALNNESATTTDNPRTNLYGGGTSSKRATKRHRCISQAPPSRPSTSKRLHGGGTPWLRNLSLTDRCRLSLKKIARLLFLQAKCGKYVPTNAAMTLICSYMMETFAQSIELLVRVRCLRASVARLSPASLLRSASNNIVEGVTLYA